MTQKANQPICPLFVAGYTIADGRWVALVAGTGKLASVGYTSGRLTCDCGQAGVCVHIALLIARGLEYELREPQVALTARDVLEEAWAVATLAEMRGERESAA